MGNLSQQGSLQFVFITFNLFNLILLLKYLRKHSTVMHLLSKVKVPFNSLGAWISLSVYFIKIADFFLRRLAHLRNLIRSNLLLSLRLDNFFLFLFFLFNRQLWILWSLVLRYLLILSFLYFLNQPVHYRINYLDNNVYRIFE